jgi:hypothetical protein
MSWYNSDGLLVKFGTEEGTAGKAGEYEWDGPTRLVELVIPDLTALTSSAVIQSDVVTIPTGAVIRSIKVITNTVATSGGSATLNIGLISTDRSSNISDTALVSALALTSIDGLGETTDIVFGSTAAGTKVGTTIGAANGLLTAKYGTAAFTAGKVTIQIFYALNAP